MLILRSISYLNRVKYFSFSFLGTYKYNSWRTTSWHYSPEVTWICRSRVVYAIQVFEYDRKEHVFIDRIGHWILVLSFFCRNRLALSTTFLKVRGPYAMVTILCSKSFIQGTRLIVKASRHCVTHRQDYARNLYFHAVSSGMSEIHLSNVRV